MGRKLLCEWNSGTSHRIKSRHPDGYVGYVVVGERGSGKSMYAYKVMAKIYQDLYNLNEFDAYDTALKHIIYSPSELIELIRHNIDKDIITPVICLDDATVHFNSYKFFVDLQEVILLKGLFDTIRTAISGLIMTCPNRQSLLSFLRGYDDYKINIVQAPGPQGNGQRNWNRFARCYKFVYYPDENKKKVMVPYQDKYSCYVPGEKNDPNTPFGAYMAKRKKYLEEINNKMIEIMEEKRKRKSISKIQNMVKEDRLKKQIDKIREDIS